MKPIVLLTFILCGLTSAQENLNEADLTQYVDKQVRYCDYVYGSHVTKGEKPVILLNLGADYPDAKLVVAIFHDDWKNFDYQPEEFLKEKQICVKGKLVLYKGKPEIIVKGPKQIEVR
ncbi:hypothetical protein [Moheibacter lacus]|uniref:Uncharacterized protein n=1 Tax=Moheibacter lacus TaxID=2745851 RepID=A0A838ZQV7_9FLAO|nr:hypothetical protein [Moheibacter lacus]MBA5628492.1 hypothetical protein [Moheibacter lacus]